MLFSLHQERVLPTPTNAKKLASAKLLTSPLLPFFPIRTNKDIAVLFQGIDPPGVCLSFPTNSIRLYAILTYVIIPLGGITYIHKSMNYSQA